MKRLLPLIVLLLTACTPVPADSYVDPALRSGYADVQATATETYRDAVERATKQYDKTIIMQATQTALANAATGTTMALDRYSEESTQLAQVTSQAGTATRGAVVTQEYVNSAATLSAFNVTQRAALYQSQQQAQRATLEAKKIDNDYQVIGFLTCGVSGVFIGALVLLLLALSARIVPPFIRVLGENRSRILVAVGIRDSLRGRDLMAAVTNLPTETGGVPDLNIKVVPGHSKPIVPGQPAPTAADFAHLHPDNRDAILVVQKMASIVGGHADQLPSAPRRIELGLYNDVAQPVINALKARNDLETRDGAGVFVNGMKWKDLDDLAQGLQDGRIDLRGRIEWKGDKRPALSWAAAGAAD